MIRALLPFLLFLTSLSTPLTAADPFDKSNLAAWCIVPFDGKNRGPEERAAMLAKLGITKFVYDYRQEHVPQWDAELAALKKHHIELLGWWFPSVLNEQAKQALDLFQRHGVKPQLWVTGNGGPIDVKDKSDQEARIATEIKRLTPIALAAAEQGLTVGLYNHGNWFGEPENQLAILEVLKSQGITNVGIVYNLHHAHHHLDRLPPLLETIKPHLLCLNLNGMDIGGDTKGRKILPLGVGTQDKKVLRQIHASGYSGPIGIIGHTHDDVERRLQDNLDGLDWLLPQLDGKQPGPKPTLRTWSSGNTKAAPTAHRTVAGVLLEGKAEYRTPSLTVEARVTLPSRSHYNIIVASDTKESGAHWEIFSMNGSGLFTAYTPGLKPDHTRSSAMICDGKPHNVAMTYDTNQIRLFVDGKVVADQKVESTGRTVVPGGFAIGKLVEGGIGSSGLPEWLRISKGIRQSLWKMSDVPPKDESTLLAWSQSTDSHAGHHAASHKTSEPPLGKIPEYSHEFVKKLLTDTKEYGDALRGAALFSNAKLACVSCHKVGSHGGSVGPDLTAIAKDRSPSHLIESVLWPRREVKPEYRTCSILTADGKLITGYKADETDEAILIKDPASSKEVWIAKEEVDDEVAGGTLMPDGLTAALTREQLLDLIRFLSELGRDGQPLSAAVEHTIARSQMHGPATFEYKAAPINPQRWSNSNHAINRDRIYDFYTKQAEHFRLQDHVPMLLSASPELDGGQQGHFGNQTEKDWASNRWNETQLGSVQAGVLHIQGRPSIPRAVCVRLGEENQLSACFNPDTLTYEAVWSDGFVSFSTHRFGLLGGMQLQGTLQDTPGQPAPKQPFSYLGYYRHGKRVAFAYRIGEVEYLDAPWVSDGQFTREVAPIQKHSLREIVFGGPSQWPQTLETRIIPGSERPFAIDTIELPNENPWKALFFCGGHDFLPDGSVMLCTMQGDVWHVTGLDSGIDKPGRARWKRFASGLHQALGLVCASDGVYVQCRDQLTRLRDLNSDGEADLYECFCNGFETSPGGHDFICGLRRDSEGYFLTASSNQGLVRMSPDGQTVSVVATGFRNPDGLEVLPDGNITVPCSEGTWTPASTICLVPASHREADPPPHYGFGGPRGNQTPELPLVYLPRAMDNSSGGQTTVPANTWGPLQERLLHFSFGMGAWFTVLRDEVDGQVQGAVLPMTGDFLSGVHRGRFSPVDHHLYVSGQQGWVSFTPQNGCFQRVRYAGNTFQIATDFHIHENGVWITFAKPVDPAFVTNPEYHFAQCWNYRYSGAYGSPELSPSHHGVPGHDPLTIASAHVLPDGRSIFLEIPDLQPVNQLHLRLHVNSNDEYPTCNPAGSGHDLFITVHRLDDPFEEFPGYNPREKTIAAHPMLTDLAANAARTTNPWLKRIPDARSITLKVAENLSYETKEIRVRARESIAFTLENPDVVPHNWALAKPGSLQRVGELANKLIADPEAFARQYVPESDDVLCYTDIVNPGQSQTIFFEAPVKAGRYPFLCTFPGHWMIMNGELIVE